MVSSSRRGFLVSKSQLGVGEAIVLRTSTLKGQCMTFWDFGFHLGPVQPGICDIKHLLTFLTTVCSVTRTVSILQCGNLPV